jgi:hypothetical protein
MALQCSSCSSSGVQYAQLKALYPTARTNQNPQDSANPPGDGASARRAPTDGQGRDYQSYTNQVVDRLSSPVFEPGNGFRQGGGVHSLRALSAYAEQQSSLEREQLDNVRNQLGVDFFV